MRTVLQAGSAMKNVISQFCVETVCGRRWNKTQNLFSCLMSEVADYQFEMQCFVFCGTIRVRSVRGGLQDLWRNIPAFTEIKT